MQASGYHSHSLAYSWGEWCVGVWVCGCVGVWVCGCPCEASRHFQHRESYRRHLSEVVARVVCKPRVGPHRQVCAATQPDSWKGFHSGKVLSPGLTFGKQALFPAKPSSRVARAYAANSKLAKVACRMRLAGLGLERGLGILLCAS